MPIKNEKKMKTSVIILILASLATTVYSQSSWRFYEDTNIKGSISGSIEEGMIFQTRTNSYYRIDKRTRQKVRVRNPDVTILKNGKSYKLVIEDFDEPVFCEKLDLVTNSSIDGEFEGWDGETTMILSNGEVWKQYEYEYDYSYSYNPEVWVLTDGYSYFMKVEDMETVVEVTQINNTVNSNLSNQLNILLQTGTIESNIIDEFEGWEGDTKFILDNGQVWQQESYAYMYHYAYRPSVKIISTNQGYLMKVEGVEETIYVTQLK